MNHFLSTNQVVPSNQAKWKSRSDFIPTFLALFKKQTCIPWDVYVLWNHVWISFHSLDDEWKNLLKSTQEGLTMGMTRNARKKDMIEEDMEGGAKDDYNILMKELQFAQKRALAQDRLKTEEEVIKENKEKLERQESERVKRMNGGDRDEEEEEESGVALNEILQFLTPFGKSSGSLRFFCQNRSVFLNALKFFNKSHPSPSPSIFLQTMQALRTGRGVIGGATTTTFFALSPGTVFLNSGPYSRDSIVKWLFFLDFCLSGNKNLSLDMPSRFLAQVKAVLNYLEFWYYVN